MPSSARRSSRKAAPPSPRPSARKASSSPRSCSKPRAEAAEAAELRGTVPGRRLRLAVAAGRGARRLCRSCAARRARPSAAAGRPRGRLGAGPLLGGRSARARARRAATSAMGVTGLVGGCRCTSPAAATRCRATASSASSRTGKGVTVHKADCHNLWGFADSPERFLDIDWDYEAGGGVPHVGRIDGGDRQRPRRRSRRADRCDRAAGRRHRRAAVAPPRRRTSSEICGGCGGEGPAPPLQHHRRAAAALRRRRREADRCAGRSGWRRA